MAGGSSFISSGIYKSLQQQNVKNNLLQLKPGQILTGKILSIYPNERAAILLGSKQITAQLQTSLNLHDNYWFQVQSLGKLPQLKVLVEKPFSKKNQEELLLKQMGVGVTKMNQSLLKALIDRRLSFNYEQLRQVLTLSNELGGTASKQVLVDMVKKDLPISTAIYHSLLAERQNGFSDQLISLKNQLDSVTNELPVVRNLSNRLGALTQRGGGQFIEDFPQLVTADLNKTDHPLYALFKKANLIPNSISLEDWKNQWLRFSNNKSAESTVQLPYNLNQTAVLESLYQLNRKQIPVSSVLKSTLSNHLHAFETSNTENQFQKMGEFKTFLVETGIVDKLPPFFSDKDNLLFNRWLANTVGAEELDHLLNNLTTLANKQLPKELEKLMIDLIARFDQVQGTSGSRIREQFLIQLKQYLYFTGLDHENNILNGRFEQEKPPHEQSLKHLLIQATQLIEGNDNLERLLSTINGLQISSMEAQNNTVQISMNIPSAKFDLKGDIKIDIESRKGENGLINPDFCRILFYLDLNKLGETIIDMSIQKRLINLTVYNQEEKLRSILQSLKPHLHSGMNKLNYQLSTVQFKNMDKGNNFQSSNYKDENFSTKGVDFRI